MLAALHGAIATCLRTQRGPPIILPEHSHRMCVFSLVYQYIYRSNTSSMILLTIAIGIVILYKLD